MSSLEMSTAHIVKYYTKVLFTFVTSVSVYLCLPQVCNQCHVDNTHIHTLASSALKSGISDCDSRLASVSNPAAQPHVSVSAINQQ